MQKTDLRQIANDVLQWAIERDFKGTDPYDGLNSRLLAPILKKSRFLSLITIQVVKRCPVNLRPLLRVPPGRNPKGLALFLSGLGEEEGRRGNEHIAKRLEQMILSLVSKPDGSPVFSADRRIRTDITKDEAEQARVFAWGYNFPWQSRAFLQPAWYPTVVCSSFILDALRDSQSEFYPIVARNLARFTSDSLNIHRDDKGICFSYSPRDNTRVYNASLFAAKILVQAASFEEETIKENYNELAQKACDYVAASQREDGSWVYGEAEHWQWVDNLHTGFVLETMQYIAEALATDRFSKTIEKGKEYYRENLFTKEGDARYFNNALYPLDPHSYAQGAITMMKLNEPNFAKMVLTKAVQQLWDSRRKGFIKKNSKYSKDRLIHLRWNQGWMFKALQDYNRQGNNEDLV